MDFTNFHRDRNKEKEKARTNNLIALLPDDCGGAAIDIGARDGWFSSILVEKFDKVTALDLEKPSIRHPKIHCVKGNAINLEFANEAFDLVFCAEVLEHIPPKHLSKVCSELDRVAKKYILIGVPFNQDLRIGRTKCYTCGKRNPPWGHINIFNENKLKKLFPLREAKKISFVGENKAYTNVFSAFLMDLAGNPYGPYNQTEPCIYCGAKLKAPQHRNTLQKIFTRLSIYIEKIQQPFCDPHPNWIHILFKKR